MQNLVTGEDLIVGPIFFRFRFAFLSPLRQLSPPVAYKFGRPPSELSLQGLLPMVISKTYS